MKDGHLNKCKTCVKADVAANYARKREQYAEYERKRFLRPERKLMVIKYQRNRRINSPEKCFANYAVSNAIRDKRLIKQPCAVCGSLKVEAHHTDYSRPLDVVWLCREHHLELHGKVFCGKREDHPQVKLARIDTH